MEKVIIETLVKKVKKINWYPKIYEDSIVGFVDLIRTSVEASHNGMKIEIIKKDYKNCYDNTNTGKPEYVLIIDIEKGNILETGNQNANIQTRAKKINGDRI